MKKKILIVDDDPSFREAIRGFLEENHFEVHEAGNGKEALEKNCFSKPDLVILDVFLPEELGFTVSLTLSCEMLLRDKPKIILVSGFLKGKVADWVNREGFKKNHGIDCFLEKPFELEDLMAEIKKLL